jgi:hypothetical protein
VIALFMMKGFATALADMRARLNIPFVHSNGREYGREGVRWKLQFRKRVNDVEKALI